MDSTHRAIARLIMRRNPAAADAFIPHGPPTIRLGSQVASFGAPWRMGASDMLELVALNPQPLPPRELYATAVTTALIDSVMGYAQLSATFGPAAAKDAERLAIEAIADFDDICPRWPRWPHFPKFPKWPPPPPPPYDLEDEMGPSELLVVASNLLAASETLGTGAIAEALDRTGTRIMEQALANA